MSTHAGVRPPFYDNQTKSSSHLANAVLFAIAAPSARIKRAGDFMLALLLMPLVTIVLAPFCLLVMMNGGTPVYRHLRLGRGGRAFYCYKLRTMTVGADEQLQAMLDSNHLAREEWSERFKLRNDPRVTRLGHFLRRTSLDELPQLWNVLNGDMSFIGPRPIIPDEIDRYGEHSAAYLACRPGISGLWQINGRNDTSYEERVMYDARYARDWSLSLDAEIFLKTIPVVLTGRGSY